MRCALTLTSPGSIARAGTTFDLSVEGVSLSTELAIAPGSRLRIHIAALPCRSGTRPLQIDAKAVYSSYLGPGSFRIGMVFVDPRGEGADVLADFVA